MNMSDTPKYITLYDLQTLIRRKVADSHPLPYWVVAEVSELKVNYSGHCYLELVEKGGDNQVPRAKVNAVIWRTQYGIISSYFRTETGQDLKSGIKVLVKVVINYHELYGLSFQITDIEPSFTLGDIEAQRRETIERLKKEGIYDMNRETELPPVIQRLAVVSSRNAAGYQDFMNELAHNPQGYVYDITLFDAFMQGNEAEGSIIGALDLVADRMDDFDALVLIRGGGSQSDLGAFNSYRLCSHLAQFPLPVITGIGHDKDQSVADLVANTSVKTPTAVAVFLTDYNAGFEEELDSLMSGIVSFAQDNLQNEKLRLSGHAFRLKSVTSDMIYAARKRLDDTLSAIDRRTHLFLENRKGHCSLLSANVANVPLRRTQIERQRLSAVQTRIADLSRLFLSGKSRELALLATVVDAKTPERILKMGYSIVRSQGRVVKNTSDVSVGEMLTLQLHDGVIETEVKGKTKPKTKK